MDQTILRPRDVATFNGTTLIIGDGVAQASHGTLFENFTLNSGYNPLGPSDPLYTGGLPYVARFFSQTDVTFRNVRFDSRVDDSATFQNGTRLTLDGCEFIGNTPCSPTISPSSLSTTVTSFSPTMVEALSAIGRESSSPSPIPAREASMSRSFSICPLGTSLLRQRTRGTTQLSGQQSNREPRLANHV